MIPRDQLPPDAADWHDISVELPCLGDNTPDSCPVTAAEIVDYLRSETADLDDADPARLSFVRTAQLDRAACWLWTYTEACGTVVYVFFMRGGRHGELLGMTQPNGLSPAQYLLAQYYDEVYWS